MSATIICIGKIKFLPYRHACDEYLRRLKHYLPVKELELKASSGSKWSDIECKRRESEAILQMIPTNAFFICLDERGECPSSLDFAEFIRSKIDLGVPMFFAIGGALGHHENLRRQAKYVLSLSHLTLPHELARVVMLEQLYRAMSILKNEPYHK
ncbi:MAG: 23S rRNA (pseudouridine(1915)-N(3))-methyltransferase RlmH [Bradymonadales bacterium]|jgi:23S rRNA (pseudouridine1915-N3)-methyltransferase